MWETQHYPSPTWEVNGRMHRRAAGHGGVYQVRILQPEPRGQRARVWATERHPLAGGQAAGLRQGGAEVGQVSQGLPAAEEAQVLCAQVPEWKTGRKGWRGTFYNPSIYALYSHS